MRRELSVIYNNSQFILGLLCGAFVGIFAGVILAIAIGLPKVHIKLDATHLHVEERTPQSPSQGIFLNRPPR